MPLLCSFSKNIMGPVQRHSDWDCLLLWASRISRQSIWGLQLRICNMRDKKITCRSTSVEGVHVMRVPVSWKQFPNRCFIYVIAKTQKQHPDQRERCEITSRSNPPWKCEAWVCLSSSPSSFITCLLDKWHEHHPFTYSKRSFRNLFPCNSPICMRRMKTT